MDTAELRLQALLIAERRSDPSEQDADTLARAESFLAFLTADHAPPKTPVRPMNSTAFAARA